MGIRQRHEVMLGPALESLPKITGQFDMVFVDANKAEYKRYVEVMLERDLIAPGGTIICDNVLYNGYPYLNSHFDSQPARRGFGDDIKVFNQWVHDHPELEQVVLPIRDGVSILRKKTCAASDDIAELDLDTVRKLYLEEKKKNESQAAELSKLQAELAKEKAFQQETLSGQSADTEADAEKAVWTTESLADAALLLDIDGTLVLTDDIYFAVFTDLLAPYGYEVDQPFYIKNVHGKVDADVFKALMPSDYGPEELKAVSEKKDALFCAKAKELGIPIIPGLGEALAMAKQHGIRCIAVTNAPRPAGALCIEEIKRQFDAGDIVEDLVIGAECTRAKPFGDPYIEGMKRLGKRPEECIVFEDSRSGIAAGKDAGVAAIVGIRSSLDDASLRAHGANASMEDWRQLTPEMLVSLLNSNNITESDCELDPSGEESAKSNKSADEQSTDTSDVGEMEKTWTHAELKNAAL